MNGRYNKERGLLRLTTTLVMPALAEPVIRDRDVTVVTM